MFERLLLGITSFARGVRIFWSTPRLWPMGLLPVLAAAIVVAAAAAFLIGKLDDLTLLLTPFADRWDPTWRDLLRVGVAASVFLGFIATSIFTFVGLTQAIGQVFYEKLSEEIDASLGSLPPVPKLPIWRSAPRAIGESLLLLLLSGAVGLPLFFLGFVPVVGQTVAPALGLCLGGFFMGIELMAIPLERRGHRLEGKLAFARAHRAATIGLGASAFALFLVPIVNLLVMPGAIVGGTLLVRRLEGKVGP